MKTICCSFMVIKGSKEGISYFLNDNTAISGVAMSTSLNDGVSIRNWANN